MSAGQDVEGFRWTVEDFAARTPGVIHVVVTSVDGMRLAASREVDRDLGDKVAAQVCGLIAIATTLGGLLRNCAARHISIQLDDETTLLARRLGEHSSMAVLAVHDAQISQVVVAMGTFARQFGHVLTPNLRDGLYRRAAIDPRAQPGITDHTQPGADQARATRTGPAR